ncbi:hypothetical protein KU6B_27260 [Mameliella alba]|uniref:hypothetical protein n=1 Tax=Mameliella TaxID=1434019 RepID=UPI0008410E06|nr:MULTISPECIES: hypothetical protein [Mameliella]MDD9729497.1 hypothetical protein [Mameliella sp. AT18]ODM49891.1 hypothetical protein A9320_12710 [Ruegeria sp. PBVC088]BBU56461.1 hypothetical protein KU6B_27260 [Mameliella alba]
MAIMPLVTAATIGLAAFSATDAETPKDLIFAQAQPFVATQGYAVPQGDYMTTPDGCTYRRTQAPGQPVRWIIVLNPHHLGKGGSPSKCKGML